MEQCVWFYYLFLIFSKDAVQDEVSPEHRPLTFNILKQLELCRIVVQPRWVLVTQQTGTVVASILNYTIHNFLTTEKNIHTKPPVTSTQKLNFFSHFILLVLSVYQ